MDYAGGSRERYDSAGKTLTTQLNARLPPGNLLTCAFLLDGISSSRLRRLLNQHVGGSLKKVLPRAPRTELEIVPPRVAAPEASETRAERCCYSARAPSSVRFPSSLIEILCRVQHSAALLIRAASQRGRRDDLFL